MSDVDRLRAAADRLDEWVAEYHCRGGGPLTLVDVWEKQAVLLRAVDHHYCDDDSCPLWDAAFALADTILRA